MTRRLDPEVAAAFMRDHLLEPLCEYPGRNTEPWPCRCMKCDREVRPAYHSIQRGQGGCPWCAGLRIDRTDPAVIERIRADQQAATARWRAAHPERARELGRRTAAARYKADPERIKRWNRESYLRNIDKRRAGAKAYYKAHASELTAKSAAWRAVPKNQRWVAEYGRLWRAQHVDTTASDRARLRRVRKSGNGAVPFQARDIFVRDGWVCQLCRTKIRQNLRWPHPRSASLDHIIPLSLGGPDCPANTQAAHLWCNQSKATKAMGEQMRLL